MVASISRRRQGAAKTHTRHTLFNARTQHIHTHIHTHTYTHPTRTHTHTLPFLPPTFSLPRAMSRHDDARNVCALPSLRFFTERHAPRHVRQSVFCHTRRPPWMLLCFVRGMAFLFQCVRTVQRSSKLLPGMEDRTRWRSVILEPLGTKICVHVEQHLRRIHPP